MVTRWHCDKFSHTFLREGEIKDKKQIIRIDCKKWPWKLKGYGLLTLKITKM